MPKLSRRASKSSKRERMRAEMEKYKRGEMHSGSKDGPRVKNRKQAIAISLSESGQSKKGRKVGKASRRHGKRPHKRGASGKRYYKR